MKWIWNALRYGNRETKKCVGSVVLFAILAIAFIAVAAISGQFYLFIPGLLLGIAALMISRTFTLVEDDFVAQVNRSGKKEVIRSAAVQKNTAVSNPNSGAAKKGAEGDTFETRFDSYNEQVLKKIKRKYHIRKDHRPIIIDRSQSYQIQECPAFIWRIHNKVFLLLLEKEPRRISISRDLIRNMGYLPNVSADRSKEYRAFEKKSLITQVFEDYLPDYFDSKVKNDDLKNKNLYTIYPDICISNRSAAAVMDLLCLNFMPDNKITRSDKINGFFKRIYAANILYKDRVYSITEYKEAVEKALSEMCYAEMPEREFCITLENLVKGRLVSQEYVNHYKELREKISK